MNIFQDSIIDKYKDYENLKNLDDGLEYRELQQHLIQLIKSFQDNREDLLFNTYYYKDLIKVIKMMIAREWSNTNSYSDRPVTVEMSVKIVEDYFIDEELKKPQYKVNILPGQILEVKRNNVYIPGQQQEYEADAFFTGTKLYLDVKGCFNPYSQVIGFDNQNYVYIVKKPFKEYYNKIISGAADDIWLLLYYCYNRHTGFRFINMKRLMEYIQIQNNEICLKSDINIFNIYKNDINNKIIDVHKDKFGTKVFINLDICYTRNEFIDYICTQYSKDIWL